MHTDPHGGNLLKAGIVKRVISHQIYWDKGSQTSWHKTGDEQYQNIGVWCKIYSWTEI